jgi:hypothetical protein
MNQAKYLVFLNSIESSQRLSNYIAKNNADAINRLNSQWINKRYKPSFTREGLELLTSGFVDIIAPMYGAVFIALNAIINQLSAAISAAVLLPPPTITLDTIRHGVGFYSLCISVPNDFTN